MCIYDVLENAKCKHVKVIPSLCAAKLENPYTNVTPCKYEEHNWDDTSACISSSCIFRALEAQNNPQNVTKPESRRKVKHNPSVLPLIYAWQRRSKNVLRKYTTSASNPLPINPKRKSKYDLEVQNLPLILEEDSSTAGLEPNYQAHDGEMRRMCSKSGTLVETVALDNTNLVVTNKKGKSVEHRVSLSHAIWRQPDSKPPLMSSGRTSHPATTAMSQAQELTTPQPKIYLGAGYKEPPPPLSLRASIEGQTRSEVLEMTPHQTSHPKTTARLQALELATTTSAVYQIQGKKPITQSAVPSDKRSFAFRLAARQALEAATPAVAAPDPLGFVNTKNITLAEKRGGRVFTEGLGVPLAPCMPVRLSAIGLPSGEKSCIPKVHAHVLETKVNVSKPPRLGRVSRMTLKFDQPGWTAS